MVIRSLRHPPYRPTLSIFQARSPLDVCNRKHYTSVSTVYFTSLTTTSPTYGFLSVIYYQFLAKINLLSHSHLLAKLWALQNHCLSRSFCCSVQATPPFSLLISIFHSCCHSYYSYYYHHQKLYVSAIEKQCTWDITGFMYEYFCP